MCHFDRRGGSNEQKIPYVRLERLKICTSEVGELPVFKLQPRDDEQEGDFLLVIKCGTQSSSMSVKVSGISWRLSPAFSPYPTGVYPQFVEVMHVVIQVCRFISPLDASEMG